MKESLLIVPLDLQGQAPEWIHIVPLGKTELRDSRPPFEATKADLEALMAAFRADGIRLVIDYEHKTLSGDKAVAAGWITDLELRADGLYARVDWTEEARQEIASKKYGYYSPVLRLEPETRRVQKLLHAGLTNNPAIKRLAPLLAARYRTAGGDAGATGEVEILVLRDFTTEERKQAAQEGEALPDGSFPIKTRGDLENAIHDIGRANDPGAAKKHIIARAQALGCMDLLPADWPGSTKNKNDGGKPMKKEMMKLLGLPEAEDKPDQEILALVVERLRAADALPEIALALCLAKDAEVAKIKGTILALKQGSEQFTTLQAEVTALKAENVQDKAQKAVDEALTALKITPAQITWALDYAKRNMVGFKAFVAAAVPILAAKHLEIPKDDKTAGGVVDETGLAVCKQMGISPADFLATKQQMAAA